MSLTHIDPNGNAVMVEIGEKDSTVRTAAAAGVIHMSGEAFAAVREGRAKKGDVLAVAQVAGILAAKRTSDLIPLCHTLQLTHSGVEFALDTQNSAVRAVCTVGCEGRTGVEMEALTGVSVALLTIYDMCKALDRHMRITEIRLVEKTGGKSGDFRAAEEEQP